MRLLRPVTEAEVMAEFLRNEFHREEFHCDRERFERLVMEADLADPAENALRRALLFRRRGHMWRELPADTVWSEAEFTAADIPRLRVFPRAQWRAVAGGSFQLTDITERIRRRRFRGRTARFISQLHLMSYQLRSGEQAPTSVLLIGVDTEKPLTVLEGNHRLTAALLASPDLLLARFRFLCGLSPRMTDSCWYETNFANLWRYAKNRLQHLRDGEADVERLLPLPSAEDARPSAGAAGTASPDQGFFPWRAHHEDR